MIGQGLYDRRRILSHSLPGRSDQQSNYNRADVLVQASTLNDVVTLQVNGS